MGGNHLQALPESLCNLARLQMLYLGDNELTTVPASMSQLRNLRTLNLHNNNLAVLPRDILELRCLEQLSLRGNPLVSDFVHEPQQAPSLLELAARTIKKNNIPYHGVLPLELSRYLDSAKQCTNPACRGVYFSYAVKSIDFVDFCGKFRIPLLKFLCSHHNVPKPGMKLHSEACRKRMKRVLLDGVDDPAGAAAE